MQEGGRLGPPPIPRPPLPTGDGQLGAQRWEMWLPSSTPSLTLIVKATWRGPLLPTSQTRFTLLQARAARELSVMSVFCKTETGEWDEGRSGGSWGEGTASEGEKSAESRLCTQRVWARMENKSSPFAQSYLHSWSLITECTSRGHNAREVRSQHPVRLPRGIHPGRLTLGLTGHSLPVILILGCLQMLLGDFPAQDIKAFG